MVSKFQAVGVKRSLRTAAVRARCQIRAQKRDRTCEGVSLHRAICHNLSLKEFSGVNSPHSETTK